MMEGTISTPSCIPDTPSCIPDTPSCIPDTPYGVSDNPSSMSDTHSGMSDNPFDLSIKKIKKAPKRLYLSTLWSENEKNEKLKNYIEVQSEFWMTIKYGSHIRYITKNEEFKCGFVVKNPFNLKKNELIKDFKPSIIKSDDEKLGIKLQSLFYAKSDKKIIWTVEYVDIKKIYIKVNAETKVVLKSMEDIVQDINRNTKKIMDRIEKLDNRLLVLENKLNA